MATAQNLPRQSWIPLGGSLLGLGGILIAHCLAFASLFFQVLWIVPVYADRFDLAVGALPTMTRQSLQFASLFNDATVHWTLLGLLIADLGVLIVLFTRSPKSSISFSVYSHVVIVGLIAYLVWNSLALCVGLTSL